MLQSLTNGLNNMLFAHGVDFAGRTPDYNFAIDWAKRTKFYKALKKAHKFGIAGGTALMKLNRSNKELFMSAHRIDTFFADIDATGKVVSVQVFSTQSITQIRRARKRITAYAKKDISTTRASR